MDLSNKTILITGASGGIGSCLVHELVKCNPKRIYAADLALDKMESLINKHGSIIFPLKLDVTSLDDIHKTSTECTDIDILINNAGVEFTTSFLNPKSSKASSIEMAVNYFGVHNLCLAFWEKLTRKESSAIINILSVASFSLIIKLGTYCASKAAAHLLTQGLRAESTGQNVKIFAVYPGYVDTQMIKNLDVQKSSAIDVARNICSSIEKDILDIFPDPMSAALAEKLSYKHPIVE